MSRDLYEAEGRRPEEICCMVSPFSVETRQFDASVEEARLVDELNRMSMKERLKIEEEVHGVADKFNEDPVAMDRLLEAMEAQIRKNKKKSAYERAVFLSPTRVKDRKFWMMFIRAESYDPVQAAQRFVRYFEVKLELFGLDRLVKDITFDDLDDEPQAVIASGRLWYQREKDRSGRGIIVSNMNSDVGPTSAFSLMQALWYTMMIGNRDEEIQRNGCINIIYSIGANSPEFFDLRKFTESFPVRTLGFHFCCDDPKMRIMLQWMQKIVDLKGTGRFRVHYGTHMEVRYALLSFGISHKTLSCFADDGAVNMEKLNQELAEERRLEYERESKLTVNGRIPFPSSRDVLLGKGRPFQTFPGNKALGELLGSRQEQYFGIKEQSEKTAMSTSIVNDLKSRGTRFLKRTPSGEAWEEINDLAARNKVAHGFRNKIQVYPSKKSGGSVRSARGADSPYLSESSSVAKRPRLEEDLDSFDLDPYAPLNSEDYGEPDDIPSNLF